MSTETQYIPLIYDNSSNSSIRSLGKYFSSLVGDQDQSGGLITVGVVFSQLLLPPLESFRQTLDLWNLKLLLST